MESKLKALIRRFLRPPLHRPTSRRPLICLGSDYGGWPLLQETKPGALLFSFGVGEDISFDLAAIDHFNCLVHAFDPPPKCQAWVEGQALPPRLQFHPVGVAETEGEAAFAPPLEASHISYSTTVKTGGNNADLIFAPVQRLVRFILDIAAGMPDIIKLDIEGFEYVVIADMLASRIFPRQFLVEFHHDLYGFETKDTSAFVNDLLQKGMNLPSYPHQGESMLFTKMTANRPTNFGWA